MRTAVSRLMLRSPRDLRDALHLLRDDGPLTPLAGATDLYVALNAGTLEATRFMDVWRLDRLRTIEMRGEVLSIGALATFTDIMRSRLVQRRLPMLAAAAAEIGGPQIRNRGTLGGNIATGSPAGDTLPVLLAAGSVVVLRSADGERRVPFDAFHTGYRRSVRRADELIVAVEMPTLTGRQWFRKIGTRAAQAIAKVVMAGIRGPEPRIAVGSVAPTVVRARAAEQVLAAGGDLDAAVAALDQDISPIDDLRSTAAYRRAVAGSLLRRFWTETA